MSRRRSISAAHASCLALLTLAGSAVVEVEAFSTPVHVLRPISSANNNNKRLLFSTALTSSTPDETAAENNASAGSMLTPAISDAAISKQRKELIRQEGGRFAFDTKFGALNPFAIYYGLTAVLLGLPWFLALSLYQVVRAATGGRFDRLRRIPIFINQMWGVTLLRLTRCYPLMEHKDILQKFYKE